MTGHIIYEHINVEVFTHFDGRVFNISDLKKWLKATDHKIEPSGIPMWNVRGMLGKHEWDANKLDRIQAIAAHIEKENKILPLICATPNNQAAGMTVDIIDGWHRLALLKVLFQRDKAKIVKFPAYWVRWQDIEQFQVPNEVIIGGRQKVPEAGERAEYVKRIKI